MTFSKKNIVFNFRNGINRYYNISHPINFLPCFILKLLRDDLLKLTKMLEFQLDDVIIYNVNEDFRILLSMWNRPLMCKISQCHDRSLITESIYFLCICFLLFLFKTEVDSNQRFCLEALSHNF